MTETIVRSNSLPYTVYQLYDYIHYQSYLDNGDHGIIIPILSTVCTYIYIYIMYTCIFICTYIIIYMYNIYI